MKTLWKYIFPGCYKGEYPSARPKKVVATKPNSSYRLSLTDLSFPSLTFSEDLSISLAGSNLHVFSLAELKTITQHFSSSNFLGEGGFGPVHKGFIDDKLRPGLKAQPVAVKLLDLDGSQGHKEWLTEVVFLGQLRHPHLVKLIGYCCEEEHRLLVYEYLPRGSLENQLFRSHLTAMSDVYSFGVVLLEILTGRKSVDKHRPQREQNLVEWARPMLNDYRKLSRIMDPRLEGQFSELGTKKAAALAYQCLSHRPRSRPSMSTVVKTLEPLQDFDDVPIGPFVYTVPPYNNEALRHKDAKEHHEAPNERRSENHHHHHNHHRRIHHHNNGGHRPHPLKSPKPQLQSDKSDKARKSNLA
ncbi:unnamed protein product [Lupinus luteus]|uniref:non-specific serine/threonine protein kinase n=1 Tax=Lupinus luteus TaxID=3873 RepID=A0AAV1XGF8_LUPLU